MERVCSRCGCTSFHYNRGLMQMVCDWCGHPVDNEQDTQQLMQFDRTYAQAMEHLRVGNWEQVINLLRPLMNQHPSEKKLYAALFRAATHDYDDIEMTDRNRASIASDAWDKLVRLRAVTGEMRVYARRREGVRRAEIEKERARVARSILLAGLLSLLAWLFFFCSSDFLGFTVACLAVWYIYKLVTSDSIRRIRDFDREVPNINRNPFR